MSKARKTGKEGGTVLEVGLDLSSGSSQDFLEKET